ncbi:cupin domain-containing protein [Streptomyces sp. NPDC017979]|uniref:cupin domain-containing protein n=1 Tax=Streptomyces sp. NPDC017979 TaxID=3365024 RepID=UPI0037949D94
MEGRVRVDMDVNGVGGVDANVRVVSESEQGTTRTPAGSMYGLAAPSRGSAEISTWRVEIAAGEGTPVHVIDREQVWTVLSGGFDVEVAGETGRVEPGQALILPAGAVRQVKAAGGRPAEALVAMPVGGRAVRPGSEGKIPLPWAE